MGDTPAQALKKAQESFGSDVLLVENKEIRKKSLTQSGLYEIVVAVDDDTQSSNSQVENMEQKQDSVEPAPNVVQKDLMKLQRKKWQKGVKKHNNQKFTMR